MIKKKREKISTITTGRNDIYSMLIPLKRWLVCCLLFFIGCSDNKNANTLATAKEDSVKEKARVYNAYQKIDSLKNIIRPGDLITRTGNDFTSESLRTLNRHDKTYSHCGIVSIENDSIFIYHALGGEFNPDQKIRRDALLLFAEPYGNRGIGIFRYGLDKKETDLLAAIVKKLFNAGVMFDMKFDLQTDDRMYCAEFVCKSYAAASSRLQFGQSRIKDFVFVGVDDLFLHPQCTEIKRVLYK